MAGLKGLPCLETQSHHSRVQLGEMHLLKGAQVLSIYANQAKLKFVKKHLMLQHKWLSMFIRSTSSMSRTAGGTEAGREGTCAE